MNIPEGRESVRYESNPRDNIGDVDHDPSGSFTRDGYTCQCCGRKAEDGATLHVHHIQYRSMGGSNRMGNLITVCDKCHNN